MAELDELRLAIIGCGNIAEVHGRAARSSRSKIRFIACCDRYADRAKQWAYRHGCGRAYLDYEEMIRTVDTEGIVLTTPQGRHREQIEKCLAAGARNILCEKTLALNGAEAAEIWEMVTAAGAFLMEGFMFRHHPAILKLERLSTSGEFGAIDSVRAVFSVHNSNDGHARPWSRQRESGGIQYDYASYAINACTHFIRDVPKRVYASGSIDERNGLINRLYGMIEYEGGSVGIVESSTMVHFNQELQISCENGILHLPVAWMPQDRCHIRQYHNDASGSILTDTYMVEKADAYQKQLENFAEVIRGRSAPVLPLAESVANAFVMDALVASLHDKHAADVCLPPPVERALRANLEQAT